MIKYSSGDGNDKIWDFNETSTLSISGGSYSTTKSGDNIIVTVGDGKISLMGAASLSSVNIDGEETPIETNSWKLDGTTATYGTSSSTLIKLTNIKSLAGVSLSGNVVTIAKSAVNAKKITLTGTGYTLALADDVTKRTTKLAAWTYSDGTATYKSSYKTAGYTLASNAKSITYSKAETPSTLATVKGVKSKSGLTVSGKVITVAESSVNKKKITLTSDDYKLKLADGLTSTTKKAAWSLNSTTATYKSSYKTAGYKLASNSKSITYSPATTATTLAQVKGAKAKPTISNDIIKLKTSTINSKVTLSGSYEFDFASGDYKKAKITGSSSADKITSHGKNISLNGGNGDDTIKVYGSATSIKGGNGADVFVFDGGSGIITDYAAEDKISIVSGTVSATTSGNDLIFNDKVTVSGAADKIVTYFDANGEHTYQKISDTLEGVKFATSGKSVTLTDDYEADKFDVADFSNYASKIITINAAKVSQPLEIIGNKKSNVITGTGTDDYIDGGAGADSIKGGNGNDTLFGGANNDSLWGGVGSDSIYGGLGDDYLVGGEGRDIFVYNNGDGHDYIEDYEQDIDKIMILSGETPQLDLTPLSNNLTFKIGEGSIIVENAIKKTVEFVDCNGKTIDKQSYSTAS